MYDPVLYFVVSIVSIATPPVMLTMPTVFPLILNATFPLFIMLLFSSSNIAVRVAVDPLFVVFPTINDAAFFSMSIVVFSMFMLFVSDESLYIAVINSLSPSFSVIV